ncbi:hypothetical protein CEXT_124131 [Caerostris extrusa]|uniref:Uncharacterized protein n=1 Tax=Caerostris extrusa TaxID=172846 RepID=A0AAV4MKK4_CAEEX|nr:hypothetical protein CEXT_124131 [Caerostris extrusa]
MALQIRCSKGFLWSPLNLERISEAPLVRAAFCFNAGVYYDDESSQNEVCAFNAPFPCTHHALLRILRGRAFLGRKISPGIPTPQLDRGISTLRMYINSYVLEHKQHWRRAPVIIYPHTIREKLRRRCHPLS